MSKNTFIPTTKGLVSAHKSQDFTSDQKTQARTNIAAAASTHTHSADDIVSGALAKARQHAQTPYKDEANIWAQAQTVSVATGNSTRSIQLTLRNNSDVAGAGNDYENEVHLVLQAGTSSNHRRYIDFKQFDGTDSYLMGVNASGNYILYDSALGHRMYGSTTGLTQINSFGSTSVEINNYPGPDVLGTGGLKVYSGGASSGRQLWAQLIDGNVIADVKVLWGAADGANGVSTGRLSTDGFNAYIDAFKDGYAMIHRVNVGGVMQERLRTNSNGIEVTGAATFNGVAQINGAAGGASTYLQLRNNGSAIGILGSDASISGGNAADVGLFVYGDNEFCLWVNSDRMVRVSDSGSTFNGVATFNDATRFKTGTWHTSTEAIPKQRFYFDGDGTTYLQGHGSTPIVLRNGDGSDVLSLASTHEVSFGANSLKIHSDSTGPWIQSYASKPLRLNPVGNEVMFTDNYWIQSTGGVNRINFATSGATYLQGYGATPFILRNGSAENIVTISSTGGATFNGAVTGESYRATNGYFVSQESGVDKWMSYSVSGTFYLRDAVNSRSHAIHFPGVNAAAALTQFSSRLQVDEAATFNGNIVQDVGAGSNTTYQQGTASSNAAWITIGGGGSIARWSDGHTYINGVSSVSGNQLVLFSSNAVAIGTNTTPTTKFHVEGTSKFTGDATFSGAVAVASMYSSSFRHRNTANEYPWMLYSPGTDASWYIRDIVNSRMQMTFTPGASASVANTTVHSQLVVEGAATFSGQVSAATEYRLGGNSFSRVAQMDGAGGWGGGYNFNVNSSTSQRDSTGTVAAIRFDQSSVQLFCEPSGSPGAISPRYSFGPTGATFNGNVISTATGKLGDFTVATLPSAASNAGYEANVTDSSVTTFGSTVAGSGSSRVKVYSNGTNWTVQAA